MKRNTYIILKEYRSRKVSFLLAVLIFICPIIFSWITLRQGYSDDSRFISFSWIIGYIGLIMLSGKH